MRAVTTIILGLITLISSPVISPAALIRPENLVYQGAFRLLGEGGETGWGWSGHAMAYYPAGDPNGPSDGYSGSLFGTGHDWSQNISEINIPVPVISSGKNLNELNTATTLQSFTDIRSLLFGAFEMPQVGLEYLPPQGSQTTGKLYFGWTQHLQTSPHQTTHGWCELNLSSPAPAGPWYIGQYDNYSTTDYLFSIPSAWADSHVGGRRLATGRFRDGGQGGQGPCIYACAPWQSGNPPGTNSTLPATPLLQYSTSYYSDPQGGAYIMNRYHHSDMWSGAAWLTSGNDSAVIFVGTKGRGECWYGNPDGECLECDDRGWWSTYFDGEIIFYNPADLAAVAAGTMAPYQPQPYAVMNIDSVLYHIDSPQMYHHVKAASFDSANGLLYVFEPLVDNDKPLVHVWKLDGSAEPTPVPISTPVPIPTTLPEVPVYDSGDYNGDGTSEIAVFRENTGLWAIRGVTRVYFGGSGDKPIPGDYDGDKTAEIGVFRKPTGLWAIRQVTRFYFGAGVDRPIPGDYNGDGSCDPGIFRESSGLWAVRGVTRVYFGGGEYIPTPGDYDGDGRKDIAVFRRGSGLWAIRGLSRIYLGGSADTPVAGDYSGNGIDQPAIYRASSGLWAIRGVTRIYFGGGSDNPVPADFTGTGRTEVGIYSSVSGLWAVQGVTRTYFGGSSDIPVTR